MDKDIGGTLVIVAGLPGSGKTEYIKSRIEQLQNKSTYLVLDDPMCVNDFEKFIKQIKKEKPRWMFIASPFFCEKHARQKLMEMFVSVKEISKHELVLFENNPIQAMENASTRTNKPVLGLIKYLTQHYTFEPENKEMMVTKVPVWKK